jgi:iron(III) transport system substrate-binding protein
MRRFGARWGRGLIFVAASVGVMAGTALAQGEVNVYSARQEALIRPQLDAFTRATGIRVNLVTASEDAIIERMRAEGRNSPADVMLTVDVARLIRATDAGLFRSIKSEILEQAIPPQYRDKDGRWYGLGLRARVFYYNPAKVSPAELSTYEALAEAKWRGRVCIRSSSNTYNQSLLAALIAHKGAVAAEQWARSIFANMARPPTGGDRDQITGVASGECDIGVANTYYYVLMQNGTDAEKTAASKVKAFFPQQPGGGTHVNVSGGGVATNAPNPANAQRLLEFLAGAEAQKIYAEVVFEYPVRPGVAVAPELQALGALKPDALELSQLAAHQAETIRIFDRVGWK